MSGNVQRVEQSCELIVRRAFVASAGLPLPDRQEAMANVKQYAAFLYLTRAVDLDIGRKAGRKLVEYIRIYPRALLALKTWHLLLAWMLSRIVPSRLQRRAIMGLFRIYGRWLIIRHAEVRRFVDARRL